MDASMRLLRVRGRHDQTFGFKASNRLHGAFYYKLRYTFSGELANQAVPGLIIGFRKTAAPL